MDIGADETRGTARRRAIEAFAVADASRMADVWRRFDDRLKPRPVRGPEVGLVMLRGRIGGGGAPFNLGEASVTRASVRVADGTIGHAMILGRDVEKARLAACLDAAWQNAAHREAIETELVAPTLARKAQDERRRAEETAATRVDFFTLVRGDD